jgi:predicted component of type VI protein secretion system
MQITSSFQGREQVQRFDKAEIVIGRPNPYLAPDLDLSDDITVSRTHARLWTQDGACWVEDRASKHGTFVNGVRLEYQRRLNPGDSVQVGATTLRVALDASVEARPAAGPDPPQPEIRVAAALNAEDNSLLAVASTPGHTRERLALLLELPLEFGQQTELDPLLQLIAARVVKVIPGAERSALLLRSPGSDELVLKAAVPAGDPAVSATLARRAYTEGRALIWRRIIDGVVSDSVRRLEMKTGMYAPMQWRNQPIGVLCVDNPRRDCQFSEDDLRLLLAVANYAAMAVANHRLQNVNPSTIS